VERPEQEEEGRIHLVSEAEGLASAATAVRHLHKELEILNSTIEIYNDKIKNRAEELFEQLRAIPPGLEQHFKDDIHKNLRAQAEFQEEHGTYATGGLAQIVAYVLSLPLQDFIFERVIVDEAQMLRNMDSGHSRLVRLLLQRCNSLHMLSATPALNRLEHIRALGSLA
jgi:SNF2 family DNA or RNA helicase